MTSYFLNIKATRPLMLLTPVCADALYSQTSGTSLCVKGAVYTSTQLSWFLLVFQQHYSQAYTFK